jgi:uncharacterized LabA/DUF88 family protein
MNDNNTDYVGCLLREISNLKEVIFTRLDGMDRAIVVFNENLTRVPTDTDKQVQHLKELHEERFDGMDKAVVILQQIADEIPAKLSEKVGSLKEIHEEKFASVQVQFRERDVRTEQSSKDSKVAVDAALQAAKEAVGKQNESSDRAILKSEAAVMKQIDAMGELIRSGAKGVDDKFQDLKDRLTRIEGKDEGTVVAKSGHQFTANFGITVLAVVIAAISAVALFLHH